MKKKLFGGLLAVTILLVTVVTGCSTSQNKNASTNNTVIAKEEPKYPIKQVEVTVPFAAGGGTDLAARAMVEYLSKEWGQSVVVVNKPGAGGATATQAVLGGAKDGYSVLTQSVSAVSGLFAGSKNLPFKLADLQLVSKIVEDPMSFVVKADAPWKDMKELNEWVKKNPDQLTYASNGALAIGTIGMAQWLDSIGADFTKARSVSTNGASDALTKVAGGHVTISVQGVSEVSNLVKAGKVKILGVSAPQRSPYFPEVQTLEEQGMKGITAVVWFGVSLPAGTPDYIVKKWESTLEKMSKDPVYLEKMKTMNAQSNYMNSADFTNFVKKEIAEYTDLVNKKGLIK